MEGEGVKMKRFDKAFKVQAVKMVTEEGQKASEVARSLGINTLKVELIHRMKFKTREETKRKIFEYVEIYYNTKRAHSTLGYLSPFEYEKQKIFS